MPDPPQWEHVLDESPIPRDMIGEWMDYYEAVPDFEVLRFVEEKTSTFLFLLDGIQDP